MSLVPITGKGKSGHWRTLVFVVWIGEAGVTAPRLVAPSGPDALAHYQISHPPTGSSSSSDGCTAGRPNPAHGLYVTERTVELT